jgi:hypothetical protein
MKPRFTFNNAVDGVMADAKLSSERANGCTEAMGFFDLADLILRQFSVATFADSIAKRRPYLSLGDSEFSRQKSVRSFAWMVSPSNFNDLQVRQSLIGNPIGSNLGRHVLHIFFMSSKEQVIRIAAAWIIAFMENVKAIRNVPTCENPRHSVGTNMCRRVSRNVKTPVSFPRCPERPAFMLRSFIHFLPETVINAFRSIRFPFYKSASFGFRHILKFSLFRPLHRVSIPLQAL